MPNAHTRTTNLELTESERAELTSMARSRSLPAALSLRARIVLACEGAGVASTEVAKRLGLDLAALQKQVANEEQNHSTATIVSVGFCPEPECPSNTAYAVVGRIFHRVTLQKGRYCAFCGEVLETRCPSCGAVLNEGACCSNCGTPYVK